jgi:hypothetical protein
VGTGGGAGTGGGVGTGGRVGTGGGVGTGGLMELGTGGGVYVLLFIFNSFYYTIYLLHGATTEFGPSGTVGLCARKPKP